MKTLLIAFVISFFIPKEYYNGYPTDFKYYQDKYCDFWELTDSLVVYPDTLYLYKVGGQKYTFNQNGEKVNNGIFN